MTKSFKKDLTGQKFGRLTVLKFVPTDDRYSHWLCRCDCSNEVVVIGRDLKNGHTKSCGCYQRERSTKHGGRRTRLYKIWRNIKCRCYNPNEKYYKNYGGRGITVCDEWRNDFVAFRAWALENKYDDTLTIDRIDNDKGYSPENCRWVDIKTQSRNRRSNTYVEFDGKKMTIAEAAEKSGTNYNTLLTRYSRGDRGSQLFRPTETKYKPLDKIKK